MILQPAHKPGVAIRAQDPSNERGFAVFVVNVRRLAFRKGFLADGAFAALMGVDRRIVFRG
jgi:hypothetical protein